MSRPLRAFQLTAILLAVAGLAPNVRAADDAKPNKNDADYLSDHDRQLCDQLLKEFVFDPNRAEYVVVPAKLRTVWATEVAVQRSGWRVAGKNSQPDAVFFADGENIPLAANATVKKLDFIAECRRRYEAKSAPRNNADDHSDEFARMRRNSVGDFDTPALIDAVWLYRLGEPKLAAEALEHAAEEGERTRQRRGEERGAKKDTEATMIAAVKQQLATQAFLAMVHAFMVRADDEALAHGQRLLKLYPEQAKELKQAAAIVADLELRKKKGTFGKTPSMAHPDGFDKWDAATKIAYWIDSLDEVEARQWGQPGGVPLGMDPRVAALIEAGDAAVPALIDAIESDERLTRSVHFWRDFSPDRTVLGVREAALTAVMSILRVRVFEPRSTGDNFTAHGQDAAKEMAAHLREYWKRYGNHPFDERMMMVLADPKGNRDAWREAAGNLARPTASEQITTTVFGSFFGPAPKLPNPAIAKFKNPTVAEAILAAMDRDLTAHEANKGDQLYEYKRNQIEDAYLRPLIELQDKQIAPELVRRYQAADRLRMQRKLAFAAQQCGDPAPMKQFISKFAEGKLTLPANNDPNTNEDDQPGNVELAGIVGALIDSRLPEVDKALEALADPKHPQHAIASARLLGGDSGRFSNRNPFLSHPFCLAFLRGDLDNTQPTGTVWSITRDNLSEHLNESGANFAGSSWGLPADLADPHTRRDQANERVCDRAAVKISETTLGLPLVHPLLKNCDAAEAEMRRLLDLYRGRFRVATQEERTALNDSPLEPGLFVPAITPLGRPATADDVAHGAALFELKGKGKVASQTLPAIAAIKSNKAGPRPDNVLVVQAEVDSDGVTHYGIIGRHVLREAKADELTDIKAIPPAPH